MLGSATMCSSRTRTVMLATMRGHSNPPRGGVVWWCSSTIVTSTPATGFRLLIREVERSRMLVVVASPQVSSSAFVPSEVAAARAKHPRILPIDIGQTLASGGGGTLSALLTDHKRQTEHGGVDDPRAAAWSMRRDPSMGSEGDGTRDQLLGTELPTRSEMARILAEAGAKDSARVVFAPALESRRDLFRMDNPRPSFSQFSVEEEVKALWNSILEAVLRQASPQPEEDGDRPDFHGQSLMPLAEAE
jgi:hypothetical protein